MNFTYSKYSKNFPNIENNLNKINEVMNNYLYYDLLIAIYCINLCVNNRSILESQMLLNLGLKTCEKTGTVPIKTYKDFKIFFSKIKPYIGVTCYDDPILEDFGQVKFKYNDAVYNVVIGTGYNSSYAQLYFLESLANKTNSNDNVTKVLKYNSNNIDYFKNSNISDGKKIIRLTIPSNKLFQSVKKYFLNLNFEILNEINNIIKPKEEIIEKEHFILYENKYFPLYNTSILVDLFDKLYSDLEYEEKNQIADAGIFNLLSNMTQIDQGKNPFVYFPIKNFNDKDKKISYTFLGLTSKENSIIAINKNYFKTQEELLSELDVIRSLASKSELKLIETRKRSEEGFHGITITNKSTIKIILYDNYINLAEPKIILGEEAKKNILECTALDMIYMLLFMESLDELEEFIDYNEQDDYEQIIGFDGDSSRFIIWKSLDHMIAKGAIKYGMINVDINTSDGYVLDYFEDVIADFPWNCSNDYLFSNPFSWNIEKETNEIYRYSSKINPTFFGYVKYLNNNQLCFFAQNLLFWNSDNIEQYKETTSLIEDITLRKLKTCSKYLDLFALVSNKSLFILYMPMDYVKDVGLDLKQKRNFVYSDCYEDEYSINIRYTVDYKKLYSSISNVKDRRVENQYIEELFLPLELYYPKEFLEFKSFLDNTNYEKKEVEVIQIPLDYIYNNSFRKFRVDTKDFLNAKKDIAKICLKNGISSGEYYGKDANDIVRKMQKELIKKFESEVYKYNRLDLHIKLLEMYSNCCHEINVHEKRYRAINDVTEEVLEDVRNRIMDQRETSKRNARTLLYLIETNLFLERQEEKKINEEEIQRLLAFSHWLINLNDSADICYFTELEAHINVDHEYVVDNISDNIGINEDEYIKRVYSKNGYTILNDSEDNANMKNIKETFDKETGLNLIGIFDVCDYLQMGFLDYSYEKMESNVYKISKSSLIENVNNIISLSDGEKYSIEQIEKNLLFLTIAPQKLKTCKGKTDYFIPFNERENRDNRFEIKPILVDGEGIIFSPSIIKNTHNLWLNGILNFMLPYEIGLPNTTKAILRWKKKYENQMVYDIKEIFESAGITFVKVNVDLYKIDRKENYSRDIGDYDVIAIDDVKKNIWIIESKVLNRVGSFYEMFNQQKNFFKEKKYDEKFQRRIDYMNDNYKRVLKSYGFCDITGFKVIPYMIFNKVLVSRYKKVDFPIISIMELEEEIKKIN